MSEGKAAQSAREVIKAAADGIEEARVNAVLEAERAKTEAMKKRADQLEAKLDEAWEATGVSSTVRGITDLADVVRSDMSAKFAWEERDALKAEVQRLRVVLDDVKAPEVGSSAERIAALAAERDEARRERNEAHKERDEARRTLEEQRAVWAAASDEASANHRRIERAALAERDEARKERDAREADRRTLKSMLKNRDEDYERAAAERGGLKAEVQQLRAVLDNVKAPEVGSSAQRIAALAAERDEARRDGDEARKERDAWKLAFEEATSLRKTANDQLLIVERERDEARKKRDDLRFERDEARKQRDAAAESAEWYRKVCGATTEVLEQAAAERDALKVEVERLRAERDGARKRAARVLREALDAHRASVDALGAAECPKTVATARESGEHAGPGRMGAGRD